MCTFGMLREVSETHARYQGSPSDDKAGKDPNFAHTVLREGAHLLMFPATACTTEERIRTRHHDAEFIVSLSVYGSSISSTPVRRNAAGSCAVLSEQDWWPGGLIRPPPSQPNGFIVTLLITPIGHLIGSVSETSCHMAGVLRRSYLPK